MVKLLIGTAVGISLWLQYRNLCISISNHSKLKKIMIDLTRLQAAVAAETTIDQSVETLLTQLAQQIKDAGTDQAALSAITDQMEANAKSLSGAITANTPAAATATAADAGTATGATAATDTAATDTTQTGGDTASADQANVAQ